MPDQGPAAPSSRAVRRMRDRLVRGGTVLSETDASAAARVLSAPADRPAMLAAAKSLASAAAAAGQRCSPDLMLEAAAALRGHRDWNALSASLPKAAAEILPEPITVHGVAVATPSAGRPGEVAAWLVHHVHHRGEFPLAYGPYATRAKAEEDLDGIVNLHESHAYRLLRWTGPEGALRMAARVFRPGMLIGAADQGEGRIEILRERSGAAEQQDADGVPQARLWLVMSGPARNPLGPWRDRSAAEDALDRMAEEVDGTAVGRLVRWDGPAALAWDATDPPRPDLLVAEAARGRGRMEVVRERTAATGQDRSGPGVSPEARDAVVWLVASGGSGSLGSALGPYATREQAEDELDRTYLGGVASDLCYRLVRWSGPEATVRQAMPRDRFDTGAPGLLLAEAACGRGHVEVVRQRSFADEPARNAYADVLHEALAEAEVPFMPKSLLPGRRSRHPVIGPLLGKLLACSVVDEASEALRQAADAQEEAAARLRPLPGSGQAEDYRDACVLFGALRTAAARVWRLDAEERLRSIGGPRR